LGKQWSKHKSNLAHTKRRLIFRYGADFTPSMQKEFVNQIKTSKAICIDRTSNSRTMWYVFYEGNVYRVIYGKNTHDIITALHLASGKIEGLKLLFKELEEVRRKKKALLSILSDQVNGAKFSQTALQELCPNHEEIGIKLQEINLQIPVIINKIKLYRY
jgi:hypothetical protein